MARVRSCDTALQKGHGMTTRYDIDGDTVIVYPKTYAVVTEVPNPITREHAISIASSALMRHGLGDVEMRSVDYRAGNHPDGAAFVITWSRP